MTTTASAQEYFRLILLTVVGQAYAAAGYTLEENSIQWAGGQYRFRKHLSSGLYAFVAYQHLAYQEPNPSRFRVSLIRTDVPQVNAVSRHPAYVRKTLGELVVVDFGVSILPTPDHWWHYRTTQELGHALAEAGHLVVGYGMPWLAGELVPPLREAAS